MKIKNFPTEIYAIGNVKLLNSKYTIGIVGSRKCTEYGRSVTVHFSKELSEKGICVVSGMAIGIDGIAHNAAIEKVGKTIAVLGSGINNIFPPENEWLFHKIINNEGCVISEYPPDAEPDKKYFPKRNRIISGLADAVLVAEAAYRSGSSITAKYAKEQGKKVYAIPSNIFSGSGLGTNILIQEGATLVIKPEEIIEDFNLSNCNVKNKENTNRTNKKTHSIIGDIMSKECLSIYKILSTEPIHINDISKKLGKSIQEINSLLTIMEIDGYVYQPQTHYFKRKEDAIEI